jgi:conjugative transfer signal peptidase TraF
MKNTCNKENKVSKVFYITLMLLGIFNLAVVFMYGPLRLNFTSSQPVGIYTLQESGEAAQRGGLVTFCLEPENPFIALAKERGYVGGGTCPSGLKPILKRLAALPGDELEIAPDGIILNGNFLHLSFRPEIDSLGRQMPPSLLQSGKISEGQALVLSQEHGNSFDSRHFGLVPISSLTGVEPVLTFKSESK